MTKVKLTWQDADYASGKAIAAWLTERGVVKQDLTGTQQRAWRGWTQGKGPTTAEFYTVDAICGRLGLHVQDVPEDAWVKPPKKASRKAPRGPDRKCETCKKKIPRRSPIGKHISPKEYKQRRFCGDACARVSKYKPQTCSRPGCNNPMPGRGSNGNERKYCSRECQWKGKSANKKQRRKIERLFPDRKAA